VLNKYEGYEFDGWYFDDETFNEPFTTSNLLNRYKIDTYSSWSSINLYAKYIGTKEFYIDNGIFYGFTHYGKSLHENEEEVFDIPTTIYGEIITGVSFQGNTNLISVTIPSTVTTIGAKAFWGCKNLQVLNYNAENATDLTSPIRYTNGGISGGAFYLAGKETNGLIVNIGKNVKHIPAFLFYIPPIEDRAHYSYILDGYPLLYEESPFITQINIPLDADLESIGQFAFNGLENYSTIIIPEKIMSIGYKAFHCGISLSQIFFNAIECNSTRLFTNCGGQITLQIGAKVKAITFQQFGFVDVNDRPPNIKQVIFEENSICSSFGREAFACISTLTSVEMPENLTDIGNSCFWRSGLNFIDLTDVTNICSVAFGDSGLRSFVIS
jgi:hypothetical protein